MITVLSSEILLNTQHMVYGSNVTSSSLYSSIETKNIDTMIS